MKIPRLTAILALLSAPLVAADPSDYTSFIRQHQQSNGVIWDMPVELQGESLSALVVEEGGALFQLWAIRHTNYRDFLIDQKLVGAYLPTAEIKIITEDPFAGVPRTRADRPFDVEVTVDGLLSGPGLPDASKKVLHEQYAAPYTMNETTQTLDPLTRQQALADGPIRSEYIEQNGKTTYHFPATSISGPDSTKVSGEEHFLVHALPDGDYAQTQIATAHIQIWPVASGDIAGLQNGDEVRTLPPTLTLTLDDLYPSSATYAQIYKGLPELGKEGKKLPGSILVLDQDKSEDRVLTVREWASVIEEEGPHTIELLTETPFGTDRLDHISFTVNRVLKIRSMVTSIK